jgi:hypothetical protein
VDLTVVDCLWHGSLRYTPVRVVLLRNLNSRRGYDLALVTTDLTAAPEQIIGRYADRWSIEDRHQRCRSSDDRSSWGVSWGGVGVGPASAGVVAGRVVA